MHSTPSLGGFTSEYCYAVWHGKTRMVWLPDSEKFLKIRLFVLTHFTNVTDTQTPHDGIGLRLCIALHGKNEYYISINSEIPSPSVTYQVLFSFLLHLQLRKIHFHCQKIYDCHHFPTSAFPTMNGLYQ